MEYWKEVFTGLQKHFRFVISEEKAVIKVSNFPFFISAKVAAGGTTYLISSFFKKDAKGNVVDKVGRLIEREAENLAEK